MLVAISVLVACKKPPTETPDFDKADLLDNVASTIILPSLNDFETKLNSFKASFDVFEADRTLSNLELVRTDWKATYF